MRTWPPIRTSDISSWTYDKNSFFVNPARYERQWNKSYVDSTITDEVPWWKSWCREINSSPDILGCCVFESWLYCKFEHNRSILRDAFGDMLEHMAYFCNRMDDYKIWLYDGNSPLHVELSTFIESHLKCIIMSIKLIIRLSFGLKLQNLPDRRPQQRGWPARLQRWKNTTIFEFSWMYRITWLERYIKGSISSKGSLSGTILVRKYEIFKSASYMYMALNNLDLANEICDEVSREICLSSICSIKAVYLRQLNTGNSLFVISSSIDLFLQVGDWNGISS